VEPAAGSPACIVLDADDSPEQAAVHTGRTKQVSRKGSGHYSIFGAAGVKPAFGTQPKKAKPASTGKIAGQTLEQWRRAMGDAVKASIHVEKWCVEARTHCTVDCAPEVFRALVEPNAASVVPPTWHGATPVVVANLQGSSAIGEVFGHSKIKGSTRMGGWSADRAELVYFPGEQRMRCWWTMR
jgi:hypothetical protein